jgi:hypothetical protein
MFQRTTPARGEVVEAAPLFCVARFSFPSSDGSFDLHCENTSSERSGRT